MSYVQPFLGTASSTLIIIAIILAGLLFFVWIIPGIVNGEIDPSQVISNLSIK